MVVKYQNPKSYILQPQTLVFVSLVSSCNGINDRSYSPRVTGLGEQSQTVSSQFKSVGVGVILWRVSVLLSPGYGDELGPVLTRKRLRKGCGGTGHTGGGWVESSWSYSEGTSSKRTWMIWYKKIIYSRWVSGVLSSVTIYSLYMC